jgi:hypothetical protein
MKRRIKAILIFVAMIVVSSAVGAGSPARPASDAGDVPQNNQKLPPGIMYSTILANVGLVAKGGWLKLGNQMQNVFIDSGKTGRAVLSRGDGTEFCHWEWSLDDYALPAPYKLFVFYDPKRPDNGNFDLKNLKLTEPGNYVLDFFMDGKKFYTFPFSVSKLEPENPFDGETRYFLDGPWSDWGYFLYANGDPEQLLMWKLWLREKGFGRPNHKVSIQVFRDSDKRMICQNRDDVTFNFSNEWVRYEFDMVWPTVRTQSGAFFKAKDLLANDGAYTLRMAIDGKDYGTWKFSIAGGRFVSTGRTVRGKADPVTFVEGGKDAFWYERAR